MFPILREKLAGKVRSGQHSTWPACQHSYAVLACYIICRQANHTTICLCSGALTNKKYKLATAAMHKAAVAMVSEKKECTVATRCTFSQK